MASIFAPVLYLFALVGSLLLFSRYYRRRAASRLAKDPWFPSHPERDTYITLLQQNPPAHETLLKAALLRRAAADVKRLIRIREDKQALNNLVQKGSVSDELWTRFLATEKELEAEIVEVVTEANTFREGWGQIIFQSANEVVQNDKFRDTYAQLVKAKIALDARSKKAVKSPAPAPKPMPPATPSAASPNGDSSRPAAESKTPTTPITPTSSTKKGKKKK